MADECPFVDIWGCCVSRDIFSMNQDRGYNIGYYVGGHSYVPQFSSHEVDDISPLEMDGKSPNFLKKSMCNEYNKRILDGLRSTRSNWIIVDLRSTTYRHYRVTFEDGKSETFSAHTDEFLNLVVDALNKKGKPYRMEEVPFSMDLCLERMDLLVEFLKERYGNNIILVETFESTYRMTQSGEIIEWEFESRELNSKVMRLNNEFIKKTGCYYIKCPFNVIADDFHRWGVTRVHYVMEYYRYALDVVDYIIKQSDPDFRVIDMKYMECAALMNDMRIGQKTSINNAVKRVNSLIKSDPAEAVRVTESLDDSDYEAKAVSFSHLYSSGVANYQKDLNKAAEWMRVACQYNKNWSAELFDILMKIGTEKTCTEAVEVIRPFAEMNVAIYDERMGAAYFEGKGIPKDLQLAAEWTRKAINKKDKNARLLLFDILSEIGTEDAYAEMIQAVESLASSNKGAMLRLGYAYMNGWGVDKDLDKAIELFKKSGGAKSSNALFDIYWEMGTEESYKEMIEVIRPHTKTNYAAVKRLSKAYREGKGVEKDPEKAAELIRQFNSGKKSKAISEDE